MQNNSELLSGVYRCVQFHLLTIRTANISVLFIATRLDEAVFKPEHSVSTHEVK